MDLNEIKEIIETDGGKLIIIEQGRPIMVVCSFEEYKKKLKLNPNPNSLNSPAPSKESSKEELKIEDLPV
jgi:PHD/YefM family antitoxin component YafN of YafNO toxin-antitoxin module